MTRQYVYGHDQVVADFVAQLIPACHGRGFGPAAKALGVIDGHGRLIAGIVWHNWEPEFGIIELSGAALPGSGWITRETLKRMYQYPFLELGCQMIVQRTPIDDEPLLRILAAYDYVFVKVPRMFGRERDGVLALLTYEAWAGNRFNRRLKHHAITEVRRAA
jgi:hypothetical protein